MYKYIIKDTYENQNICICKSPQDAEEMILAIYQEEAYKVFCFHGDYDRKENSSSTLNNALYFAKSYFLSEDRFIINKTLEI